MLKFLIYTEAPDQQKVKRFDPKFTDVIFYLLDQLALHANMPLMYPLGMLLGRMINYKHNICVLLHRHEWESAPNWLSH